MTFMRVGCFMLVALVARLEPAVAQSWIWDARVIAMGAVGPTDLAGSFAETGGSMVVTLPFGLVQVLPQWASYDPGSPQFDPVRATEAAINPFHYVIGRRTSASPETLLASDIRAARLSR